MASRTLLIGLDGATFTVLDPLMAEGHLPTLAGLVARGTAAPLRSVVPALTPPAWTSLMTGRAPGRHGIFDFFRRDSPDTHEIRFLTSRDIEVETVWEIVSRHRRRATVLNFPLTFPAPPIEGYVVPGGWMPWRQLRLGCRPPGLYDRLKALPGFNPREIAMDMAHEEKALEGCRREEYAAWIDLHIRRERQWGQVCTALMREDPTELTAVMFDGVDKLQHLCWRFIAPQNGSETDGWAAEVRARCLAYFQSVDAVIAGLLDAAGPDTTVIVASDHGFGPQVRTFFVNSWLAEQGYLAWIEGREPRVGQGQTLGMGHLARHVYELDWTRTLAYAPMPSGNGIHIVRRNGDGPGVRSEEFEGFCERLIDQLCAVRDPETGERVVARVWKGDEIFSGPRRDVAPDLTLELTDGGLVSILASASAVERRPEATGTHRPEGIFIAAGPGIRRDARVEMLSILDVAPLLLYALDLPVPVEFEGRLPEACFMPGWLDARPPRQELDAERQLAREAPPPLDPQAEEEIMRRLQALGYVE